MQHDEGLDSSLPYAEALYLRFLQDPAAVPAGWRRLFETEGGPPVVAGPSWGRSSLFDPRGLGVAAAGGSSHRTAVIQHGVDTLVRAYRVRGHRRASVDPLGGALPVLRELDLAFHGLTQADLDTPVLATYVPGGRAPLRRVIEHLETTYCRSIGAQFMHIDELDVRDWLVERMEKSQNRISIRRAEQLRILSVLTHAVVFEAFIQRKYLGAKSFSLEGGESLIPLLDMAIEDAARHGVEEIVLGMSHRGRLNVLANIIGKAPWRIFREFEDSDPGDGHGRGDVKYHMGYSADHTTSDGKPVHLSLCFNPSHLEYVDGVVLGRVRAKQDRRGDEAREKVMGLIIHGDAACAGEGVVQETLNLSQLPSYGTGGTLHVVVNNQIGFTTLPDQGRSWTYASDAAKALQIPIFHVNGEDPEGVAQVVRLALDFRQRWHRDVFIDMYCYRLRGHNEGDEPGFTQPTLYERIRERKRVGDGYFAHLEALGQVTKAEAEQIEADAQAGLERHLEEARADDEVEEPPTLGGVWQGYYGGAERDDDEPATAVDLERLRRVGRCLTTAPEGFSVHPKLQRVLEQRRAAVAGEAPADWATAELLALGTLALDGHRVRLTGQDSERGTFSQRHSIWHDADTGVLYAPLTQLADDQGAVEIANSPLSEAGVLGFEYGYSLDTPDGLTLWEAQFGDFVNAAQVIVDQFIVSAEDKWRRLSGLVLLLPHGYEGQGPEHSSARLERFLALAAEDNIQVAQPSTAAQYFHLLRRQMQRRWRKPLVVLTPKSLLRKREVASPIAELAAGSWRRLLPDPQTEPSAVRRVLLATGRVVYDLLERQERHPDVALLRLEQLHPLPAALLQEALAPYPEGVEVVWVQDEPANMGTWPYLRYRFGDTICGRRLRVVSRAISASPATGSHAAHVAEQQVLLERAFHEDER